MYVTIHKNKGFHELLRVHNSINVFQKIYPCCVYNIHRKRPVSKVNVDTYKLHDIV